MNLESDLDVLLQTPSADVGCSIGFELLHRYVEEEFASGHPDATFPGVAGHIASCPACREDYLGLREASQTFGDDSPDLP